MGVTHLDYVGLHMVNTEKILNLKRAENNPEKNLTNPVSFHIPKYYTSVRKFLGKLKAMFIHHRKGSSGELIMFLNTLMSHTHIKSILQL